MTPRRVPAVRVQNLHKVFRVWRRPADMLIETVSGRRLHSEFDALTDVSFEVERGSVFGILGRNGAGKSTLLRIVAGTLDATGGIVEVNGRIAAILELGTGFHPEYTGRENIYLGGLCLGLSRREIDDRIDEIIAFADLEEFIDRPFRTFSSGMQARLTFSVATSVDPDLLIIDEALAVGDARFALKSFDRIRDFARRGKSILFVSHDINQVATFCDRSMVLEKGRVFAIGDPPKVGNIYHELLFKPAEIAALPSPIIEAVAPRLEGEPSSDDVRVEALPPSGLSELVRSVAASRETAEPPPLGLREHRYGDGRAQIVDFYVQDKDGRRMTRLESLKSYVLVAVIRASESVKDVCLGVHVRTERGVEVFGTDSFQRLNPIVRDLDSGQEMVALASFRNNLAPGRYFLTASLARTNAHKHDSRFDALEITVAPADGVYNSSIANLEMDFEFHEVVSGKESAA